MRGGAQAHLLACDDGGWYVTKFRENPQHRRILVNEWVASVFLGHLRIAAPQVRVVSLSAEFLSAEREVCLQLGSRRTAVEPGWHFGSQFPGNPNTDAVYDYLPDSILGGVANLNHFLGVLVFDKWTANSDSRQAIFFRRRLRDWLEEDSATPQRKGFIAQMVDHGYIFDGPNWDFNDSPIQGLYFRPQVYETVRGLDSLQPWLDQVRHCPESVFDHVWREVPRAWLDSSEEEREMERLLARLLERRGRVEELLLATARARAKVFPNWQTG